MLLEHRGVSLNLCSSFVLRQGLSLNLYLSDLVRLSGQHVPETPVFPALVLQAHPAGQGFLHECWVSELKSPDYTATALLADWSAQPL